MVLMVSFSSRISPLTSTVIFLERSPRATAVVTSAMLRTCDVRFDAIELTESVKSFHVPATPCTSAWPPSFPSVPTSRATRVTSAAKLRSWSTIVLMVFFSSRISPFTSTVILVDRSPFATAVVTCAMLRTCEVRLPAMEFTDSVRSFHVPETPFGSHFASDARHLRGERRQLVHHRVDGVLQFEDLAFHVHRDLAREVAARDRRRHVGDVPHLARQVAGHGVHRVGQILPRARHALNVGLAAQPSFGAHLARDARRLGGERRQLVHHGVD